VNNLLTIMQKELLDVARRETNSLLRQKNYDALSSLSFHDILDEMKNRCPTVFQILSNMLQYDTNREKNTACLMLMYAVRMFRRCHELSSIQRINTVLLAEGNANREVNFYYWRYYIHGQKL
jgi:hypothetical protein